MKRQTSGLPVDLPEGARGQIRDLIDQAVHSIMEQIQERACKRNLATFDECLRAYDPPRLDAEDLSDISIKDQIQLIESLGSLPDLDLSGSIPESLRAGIEKATCRIVIFLAESRARELFEELEAAMNRHDLEVFDMIPSNPLADRPHQTERPLGDRCIVFGYRAQDGSIVEVLEFRLASVSFFFQKIRR